MRSSEFRLVTSCRGLAHGLVGMGTGKTQAVCFPLLRVGLVAYEEIAAFTLLVLAGPGLPRLGGSSWASEKCGGSSLKRSASSPDGKVRDKTRRSLTETRFWEP